jgi:hypothetical protein
MGKLESIHQCFFLNEKNEGRQLDRNTILRRLEFMPKTSPKNAIQEFHLWKAA